MTSKTDKQNSFSAFTSARDENDHATQKALEGTPPPGNVGANAKPDEITTLERRVLAHERILQALAGHLASENPKILTELKIRFESGHNLGEYEQSFVTTEQYGDNFIKLISIEVKNIKQNKERNDAKDL